tara:strand:- start:2623 stop:3867 length:1245 start_codon:yes stop_codon:yes gene_type:complete
MYDKKDSKDKVYVAKTILNNPTFLLTQNIVFDIRASINYNLLDDETVLWVEEVFIPFLAEFNKVCEPVISFCQKYREGDVSKIENAINDKKNYDDMLEKSQSFQEKVELLETRIYGKKEDKKKQEKQLVVLNSLKSVLKKNEKVSERLTSLESKIELQEQSLKVIDKELKTLEKTRQEYNDEFSKFKAGVQIVSRNVESSSKLLKKYLDLLEKSEQYIESHFFKEDIIKKFSIGLWGRLKSIYFNVRKLFSSTELQKQLEQYIHEEDVSSIEQVTKQTSSKESKSKKERKQKEGARKESEKPVSKFIPDLDRILKNAFVRDVTKDSVDFDTKIMRLQKNIDSIDRRKKELNEQFVEDAVRRSKNSNSEISELGKLHTKLYERILVSFESEKRVVELSIQELQEKLVKKLVDEIG